MSFVYEGVCVFRGDVDRNHTNFGLFYQMCNMTKEKATNMKPSIHSR